MTGTPAPHILMTADAVGGVWQYAVTLSHALVATGHRVTLAVLGPQASAEQRAQLGHDPRLELIDTGLPLDWLAGGADAVERAAQELAHLAARLGADLVHCNSPALVGAARFPVPVVAVAHGCVATWWQAAKSTPLDAGFSWHARMMRAGLRAADAIVAPSASFAATLRNTYALPRAPLVVHNGRAPLGASPADSTLDAGLTVGRLWDPVKNAVVLDQAAAEAGVPLLAAGALQGPHGEVVSPRHLQLLGQQSERDLAQLMRRRPVFVSAATFEPFGLAVLEAASAGCARVLSDLPTFRELWDGAALFVEPDNASGFADSLTEVIEKPDLRARLGTAAQERSARYTPAAMAEAMMRIYGNVLVPEHAAA